MGIFEDEYQYGEDDYIDKKIRLILKVDSNYLESFHYDHNRYPRREEIMQTFAKHSARGDFYYVDNSREELDIAHERRRQKRHEEDDSNGSVLGTLFTGLLTGIAFGAAYLYNQISDEDDYYEEDE